jgi:WD40 repeat protein
MASASNSAKNISRKKGSASNYSPMINLQAVKPESSTVKAETTHELENASLEELEKFWDMASNAQNLPEWTGQTQSEDISSMMEEDLFNIKGNEDALGNLEGTEELQVSQNTSGEAENIANSALSDSATSVLEPIISVVGHTNKVTACALDPNYLILASIGNDRMLLLWDVSQAAASHVPQIHKEEKYFSKNVCAARFLKVTGFFNSTAAQSFLFSENVPVILATCGYDKCVTITKIDCEKPVTGGIKVSSISKATTFSGHQRSVTSVDFCPFAFFTPSHTCGMGFFVASVDTEGELIVWDAWTGQEYLTTKLVCFV